MDSLLYVSLLMSCFLQRLLNLNLGEGFKHVAHLDVVEVDERDTTLKVGGHLFHVLILTFRCSHVGGVNHDAVAYHTSTVGAVHLALCNHTASHGAHL